MEHTTNRRPKRSAKERRTKKLEYLFSVICRPIFSIGEGTVSVHPSGGTNRTRPVVKITIPGKMKEWHFLRDESWDAGRL